MNVLILGGNGYIGSKVTQKLVEEGCCVVCTKRRSSNLGRLADIKEKIRWIPASVDGVESALQYMDFDYVLNMSCNYGKGNALYDDVIDANIGFPLRVLSIVVEHGTKKFLTIGTGLPDELNLYSFSKKMFSEFGRFYANNLGITFNNLLLEMFYGADEPDNRFLPSVISKMLNGEIVETTVGTQHRDIIRAEDVISAIMMIVKSNVTGFHEIPIGTGVAPTISEVLDYIWEKTGKKSEIHKGAIPMRIDEPDCIADVSMLKSMGDWKPLFWKQGIETMINTMRGKQK